MINRDQPTERVDIPLPHWITTLSDPVERQQAITYFGFHLAAICHKEQGSLRDLANHFGVNRANLQSYVSSVCLTPLWLIERVNQIVGSTVIPKEFSREATVERRRAAAKALRQAS